MQKVYLLLRSNKQTGPYSLEELLQFNLKPFDLVWVEGRSAAWQYPFEIPALKPYVPETPQTQAFQPIATAAMEETLQASDLNLTSQPQDPIPAKPETPRRVFVSIPKTYTNANEQKTFVPVNEQKPHPQQEPFMQHQAYMPPVEESLHQRAEEVKPAGSHSRTSQKPVEDDSLSINYSKPLHEVEEDYTNWVYRQKTKKKPSVSAKDIVLVVLILAVIGGGYYVMSKPSVANSVLPANKIASQPVQQAESKPEAEEEKKILQPEQGEISNTSSPETREVKNNKTKNPVSVSKSQTTGMVHPSPQNPMPVEKTTSNIPDNSATTPQEPEVKQTPRVESAPQKKKKLGEVIKGIFSKKEKNDESKNDQVVLEDPKRATNRQATKRESSDNTATTESSTEANTAALMDQIELSSNAPDNWMMGVRNLKITLRNRSNVTIQTASVTVMYYDENNQLLDKKLIYFSNVAPKAKATVGAPDHKWADHVDFKLATVAAKDDRYARY